MHPEFIMTAPEQKGLSSENIIAFYRRLQEKKFPLHSALVYIDGAIVSKTYYAPIREGQLHRMFSIAKTVTALSIGLLIDQRRLSLDDHIVDYFPEKLPENVHPYLSQLTIRDMLMMRTCYTKNTYNKFDLSSDWVGSFFTSTPDKVPGTIFHYDTAAAHVLAALCEKLSGQALMDFFRSSLPELGLSKESYMLTDSQGVSMGGTGLMATTEDLLRIGILLYQQGEYNGRQLISRNFILTATSNLTPTIFNAPLPSESCGYGYMIWQTEKCGFVCYGMGGQFIIVQPDKKLILVTTADTQGIAGGNQILYDAFYQNIYTPLASAALPENTNGLKILRELETANYIKPVSELLSGNTEKLAKNLGSYRPCIKQNYSFPENRYAFISIFVSTTSSGGIIELSCDSCIHKLPFGYTDQAAGQIEAYNTPCFGSGVWLSEDTLYLKFHLLGESVGSIHMELVFAGKQLILSMRKVEETLFHEFQGTYICK